MSLSLTVETKSSTSSRLKWLLRQAQRAARSMSGSCERNSSSGAMGGSVGSGDPCWALASNAAPKSLARIVQETLHEDRENCRRVRPQTYRGITMEAAQHLHDAHRPPYTDRQSSVLLLPKDCYSTRTNFRGFPAALGPTVSHELSRSRIIMGLSKPYYGDRSPLSEGSSGVAPICCAEALGRDRGGWQRLRPAQSVKSQRYTNIAQAFRSRLQTRRQ